MMLEEEYLMTLSQGETRAGHCVNNAVNSIYLSYKFIAIILLQKDQQFHSHQTVDRYELTQAGSSQHLK